MHRLLAAASLLVASWSFACEPCGPERASDWELLRNSELVVHVRRLPAPPPKPAPKDAPKPPERGSQGGYQAAVLKVLKGSAKAKISVSWNYGMCSYPAPDIEVGAEAVLFLSPSGDGTYAPGSNGCGSVMFALEEGKVQVDDETLTLDALKKRLAKK